MPTPPKAMQDIEGQMHYLEFTLVKSLEKASFPIYCLVNIFQCQNKLLGVLKHTKWE